jgi:hypothetical protein
MKVGVSLFCNFNNSMGIIYLFLGESKNDLACDSHDCQVFLGSLSHWLVKRSQSAPSESLDPTSLLDKTTKIASMIIFLPSDLGLAPEEPFVILATYIVLDIIH